MFALRYELPDKSVLDVGWERFHVPEILFNPSLIRQSPPPWLRTDPSTAPGADGATSDASALSPGAAELAAMIPDGVMSLPELVSECIRACDTDMRRELWGGIVVVRMPHVLEPSLNSSLSLVHLVVDIVCVLDPLQSGGTSLLPGLTERLHSRLNELVPQMSMKVKLISPPTPQVCKHEELYSAASCATIYCHPPPRRNDVSLCGLAAQF